MIKSTTKLLYAYTLFNNYERLFVDTLSVYSVLGFVANRGNLAFYDLRFFLEHPVLARHVSTILASRSQ